MEIDIKLKKRLDKWYKNNISQEVSEGKKIILFGCVPMAKVIRDLLNENNVALFAIVDNNAEKTGQECLGTMVYTPNTFLSPYREDAIIIIWHDAYWKEMVKQVKKLGYPGEQIKVFHTFPILKDNISIKADFYSFLQVIKGWKIYKRELDNTDMVFLCPYKGTGDVYLAGGYFNQYIRKNKIDRYKKVAALYSIQNVKIISEKECRCIMQTYDFCGERMRLKPLLYWGWRTKKFVIQRFCKNINFDDMFKYDVYNMSVDSIREKPKFVTSPESIDAFFSKYNLIKGKTVILAPYAGSFLSDIPMEYWKLITDYYLKRGFVVCTNSACDKEKVIPGTIKILFDLRDTVPIIENAGIFIGLRSGLCDIASSAKCKKIIFYESDFFSLNEMGLCSDAIEIIYAGESATDFYRKTENIL